MPNDPDPGNAEPTAEQRRLAAARINDVLVSFGRKPEGITGWWNTVRFAELGDETPLRAWLNGRRYEVCELVGALQSRSVITALRITENPAMMAYFDKRAASLDHGPLGQVVALQTWAERGNSSDLEVQAVREFVDTARVTPWLAPSVPLPGLSGHSGHEFMSADVPATDVTVLYEHTHASDSPVGAVDLLWVGRRSEASTIGPPP